MSSRSLDDLRKDVKDMALAHVAACKASGIELLIYCTLRSNAEQDKLFAMRPKVTNARAGQSKHNPDVNGKATAYDCVPCISGKPQWANKALYAQVGALGESVGLKWSGRWTGSLKEVAHFEV